MDPFPANIKGINELIVLVESGIDLDKKYGFHHETLLHYAVRLKWIHGIEYMISKGADVNARDRHNNIPLHDAACYGITDIAMYLLENGADKLATNINSQTSSQVAAFFHFDDLAKLIESFEQIPTKGVYL